MTPLSQSVIVVSLLFAAPFASASIVAYDFTATVNRLTYFEHVTPTGTGPGVVLNTSSYAGKTISMGDQVRGQFFYDTTLGQLQGWPPAQPDAAFAYYGGPGYASSMASISYTIKQGGLQFASRDNTPVISIGNSIIDSVHLLSFSENTAGLVQEVGITLIDRNKTAFNSIQLPDALPASHFTDLAIYNSFRWRAQDDALSVAMNITSLTPTAPVPEPASWGMLLSGVGALALIARRKARQV